MLPGGFQEVIANKMNILECLGKVVFGPLTPREGVWGGSSPHSRAYLVPWCLEGGWGDPPPILGTKLASLSKEGGLGGSSPHSRDKIGPLE